MPVVHLIFWIDHIDLQMEKINQKEASVKLNLQFCIDFIILSSSILVDIIMCFTHHYCVWDILIVFYSRQFSINLRKLPIYHKKPVNCSNHRVIWGFNSSLNASDYFICLLIKKKPYYQQSIVQGIFIKTKISSCKSTLEQAFAIMA